ncbi:MAG: hypothetical protein AUK55_12155 [Syntrophobacteraceae bacterium CG2_30_61_12]|nr:MAG: hypothetical protein AUK55_12155 [Syntrophobacteraceae bacterium CG2_30_61_12]
MTDLNTGLMWQQGDEQNDAGGRIWEEALDYCDTLTFAGYDDWRLPNDHELVSIVNYGGTNPNIDTRFFPSCRSSISVYYWSGSSDTYDPNYAWEVCFYDGSAYGVNKMWREYVRCVRMGP